MRPLAALTGRCICSPTDRADIRNGDDHGPGQGDVGSFGQCILVAVSAKGEDAVIVGIGDFGADLRRKANRAKAVNMTRRLKLKIGRVHY